MISLLWKEEELIRDKRTGKPYFVVHVFRGIGTIIIDLEEAARLPNAVLLFERDYEEFAPDLDMERVKSNGINYFEYNPKALSKY